MLIFFMILSLTGNAVLFLCLNSLFKKNTKKRKEKEKKKEGEIKDFLREKRKKKKRKEGIGAGRCEGPHPGLRQCRG